MLSKLMLGCGLLGVAFVGFSPGIAIMLFVACALLGGLGLAVSLLKG